MNKLVFASFLLIPSIAFSSDSLLKRLFSEDRKIHSEAIEEFNQIKEEGNENLIKEILPGLIEALKTGEDRSCNIAAYCLGELGEYAKEAVPIFRNRIISSGGCPNSYRYIHKMGPESRKAVPDFMEVLNKVKGDSILEQYGPGIRILRTLRNMGSYGKEAVPDLLKLINRHNEYVSTEFINTLVYIDPKVGLPILIQYIKDSERGVKWQYWIYLEEFQKENPEAMTPEARRFYEENKNNPPQSLH